MATLPLFHVFGMNSIMNCTIHARGLMTLVPRFEPGKVLEAIERPRHHVRRGADDVRGAPAPAVREAAVIGVPHESLGEEVGGAAI